MAQCWLAFLAWVLGVPLAVAAALLHWGALPAERSGQVVAELDVNSFQLARFQSEERLFLEELCLLLTDRI